MTNKLERSVEEMVETNTAITASIHKNDMDGFTLVATFSTKELADKAKKMVLQPHQELQKARAEAWQEAVDLADHIELREPDGGTKQWMAFKAFRNTLRDKIKNQAELDHLPDRPLNQERE